MAPSEASPRLLNLGCGRRWHASWTNVDFVALDSSVIAHDLRRGVPFASDTYDAVYHSHVLEHFSREAGRDFLRECHRVLRRDGVLRIVVPDLEAIARLYLRALEQATDGDEETWHRYEWLLLEMYDQAVRERPGGAMQEYLSHLPSPNARFVLDRVGAEASSIAEAAATGLSAPGKSFRRLRVALRHPLRHARELALRALLGAEYDCLRVGRFRRGGEIHLWMYDRFSLCRLLGEMGFSGTTVVSATQSQIVGWQAYQLDSDRDGNPFKPDSLYVEALKR